MLLPTFILAVVWRIYPTLRWLWFLLPIVLFALFTAFYPGYSVWLFVVDVICILVLMADLLTLPGTKGLHVTRQMVRTGSINSTQDVTLNFENRSKRLRRLQVSDDSSASIVVEKKVHNLTLPPFKRAEITYRLRPVERGSFVFEKIFLRQTSKGGLWARHFELTERSVLHVYPDLKQLGEYALLARTNRLSLIGVRKTRKAGQDNNFERLRDYNQDDNYKHIDWRSSAKRNKLTVKQFQTDQSQRIMFLLDCGRLMTNEYRGLSLLDYTLNAMLMLSYVALDQGDSVGLLCFSDKIQSYVPIRGGKNQMNRLIRASFDRFPSNQQSNYGEAFLHCSKHCRKRSLVVLLTSVIDDVSAAQITGYLSSLRGRHLPLVGLLRDRSVFDYADNPHEDPSVLYRSAAAAQLLLWRHELIQRMKNSGVLAVDTFPDGLTSSLVNEYLSIKAKHLL